MGRKDGFFPETAERVACTQGITVYRMAFPDGWGTMTAHKVMTGVTLIFNDFHTAGGFPAQARCPGLIEINHCQTGRFACTMGDGREVWLGPGDFSVSDMGRPPLESRFSQGLYQGISLVLEPQAAGESLRAMVGEGMPALPALFSGLLSPQSFLLLRSESKIQQLFSALYQVTAQEAPAYYKLKTAELMLFLQDCRHCRGGTPYCPQSCRDRTRAMGEKLTQDLQVHLPIAELARAYQLGETTVKKNFRQLYGASPYAYLKRRRMEEAAFLLTTTDQTITQIAAAVGYQNASKFSAAFRTVYGLSPREYKKQVRLE